jgi:dimethylaniline monooxygenase (N-oxide forming)
MATGYHYKIPLLDESILQQTEDNKLNLYKQVFPPQLSHPSLAVIGALSPNNAIFPLMEMQARWYALLMAGKCQLPSSEEMLQWIKETENLRKAIYHDSVKNTLSVDWMSYIDDIAKQIGVYPDFKKYLFSDLPLFLKLVFGTTLSYHYRLDGPHSWSGARDAIMEADNRIRYALNPSNVDKKSSTYLNVNSYKILISLVLILFAFLIFDIID